MNIHEYIEKYPDATLSACYRHREVFERRLTETSLTTDLYDATTDQIVGHNVTMHGALSWCYA